MKGSKTIRATSRINARIVTQLSGHDFDVGLRAGQSNEINRFYTGVARGLDLEMLLARQDSSRGRRKSERGVSMIKIASDRP
jgi:hypothetical protein